ncbi:MAG: site-2 protease family protein, partial [Sulfurovaceae bacterium]
MSEMDFDIVKIIAIALSFIVAIVGHEIMHGYTAYKLGDNTAKNAGRLS